MMEDKECTGVSGYSSPDEALKGLESRVAEFGKALDGVRASMEHFFALLEEMSEIIGETR